MNKKGFTLVELLAVIVILAIIALIATPQILNIIVSSRESATSESVDGIYKAIGIDYAENLEFEGAGCYNYSKSNKVWTNDNNNETLNVSGSIGNAEGRAFISDSVAAVAVFKNGKCHYKTESTEGVKVEAIAETDCLAKVPAC